MSRIKLFISHATPKDNYYAAWLASKLRIMGYDVWVDLNDLNKGSTFWLKIQNTITNESIKFLSIVTQAYCDRSMQERSGVLNEITCACDVIDIKDFIIPLRFENVPFNSFPIQIRVINAIDFCNNWEKGLKDLLKQLEDDKIPKQNMPYNPLEFWLQSKDVHDSLTDIPETYYSNWFKIELPKYIFFHQPSFLSDNKVSQLHTEFAFKLFSNKIVSFLDGDKFCGKIDFEKSVKVETEIFVTCRPYVYEDFITVAEPNNLIIELLNRSFEMFALYNSLCSYEMSHGSAFYFTYSSIHSGFVKLNHVGKGNKKIMGIFKKENLWHFAISQTAHLKPFPHYRLASHILFSNLKGEFYRKEEQHTLRRSFATDAYNKDWLDYLLAFVYKMCKQQQIINLVEGGNGNDLRMQSIPFNIKSDKGYIEPSTLNKSKNDA